MEEGERSLVFSLEEYGQRLKGVRRAMAEREIDVLLVDDAEHLLYLAGFSPCASVYQVCAVPLEAEPVMVARRLDEPSFRERTWLRECIAFADWEDPVAVLAGLLRQRGWADGCLGVELDSHYCPVGRHEAIRAALPDARWIDFSGVIRELRLRKSPGEIAYLRQAARIADAAMREAIAGVGEGRSERDAAAIASRVFVELGADHGRVGPIMSGTRSGFLHGGLGDHRLRRGDVIHMELVPRVHGYSARLMRPTVIGEPSREQAETARQLVETQDRQLAAMKPGAAARDIDRVVREGVLAAGLRETYDNVTGYTLGLYAPWGPRTSDLTRAFLPTAEWALEPGMVFHMYTSARGLAFSETVLVTDDGAERLTGLERRLFVRSGLAGGADEGWGATSARSGVVG